MQGFLPTLYFYLYNISGGTVTPADTDTGLTFITKSNAKPFTVSSRFQGSTSAQKYIRARLVRSATRLPPPAPDIRISGDWQA